VAVPHTWHSAENLLMQLQIILSIIVVVVLWIYQHWFVRSVNTRSAPTCCLLQSL